MRRVLTFVLCSYGLPAQDKSGAQAKAPISHAAALTDPTLPRRRPILPLSRSTLREFASTSAFFRMTCSRAGARASAAAISRRSISPLIRVVRPQPAGDNGGYMQKVPACWRDHPAGAEQFLSSSRPKARQ